MIKGLQFLITKGFVDINLNAQLKASQTYLKCKYVQNSQIVKKTIVLYIRRKLYTFVKHKFVGHLY